MRAVRQFAWEESDRVEADEGMWSVMRRMRVVVLQIPEALWMTSGDSLVKWQVCSAAFY